MTEVVGRGRLMAVDVAHQGVVVIAEALGCESNERPFVRARMYKMVSIAGVCWLRLSA